MAFVPAPNVCAIEVLMELDGQQIENTLYAINDTGWDSTELTSVAQIVAQWWDEDLSPYMSTAVTLRGVKATDLASETGATFTFVPPTAKTGKAAVDPNPNNVAFAVQFGTAGRGRSSRGRNYVPGIPENAFDKSTLNVSTADSIRLAYAGLINDLDLGGFAWVVLSRFANNAPRAQGLAQPVTNVRYADRVADSQRRRLPGRGK